MSPWCTEMADANRLCRFRGVATEMAVGATALEGAGPLGTREKRCGMIPRALCYLPCTPTCAFNYAA
jgi:hypothetical protein